jgi:hypothetical protein
MQYTVGTTTNRVRCQCGAVGLSTHSVECDARGIEAGRYLGQRPLTKFNRTHRAGTHVATHTIFCQIYSSIVYY